jgi:hypothetical protein
MRPVVGEVKLVKKSDSRLMRFLGKLMFFNKKFMTRFYTTLGSTIYVPDDFWDDDDAHTVSVFAHECKHIHDKGRLSIIYEFIYVCPQILALLSLLALLAIWFSNWWLMALLALPLAAPIPSPGRMFIERRGYLMTLACTYWLWGRVGDHEYDWVSKQFTSGNYYWMWPFKRNLRDWFRVEMEYIKQDVVSDPVFKRVHEFWKQEGLTN